MGLGVNVALQQAQASHAKSSLPAQADIAYLCPCRGRRTAEDTASSPLKSLKDNPMFDTVVTKFRSYRKYQETFRELSRLSSRELADLGISRSEIPHIARRAAR